MRQDDGGSALLRAKSAGHRLHTFVWPTLRGRLGNGAGQWRNMVLISPRGVWCHVLLREDGSEEKGEIRRERVKRGEGSEDGLVAQSCSRLSSAIHSSEGRGSSRLEYLSCSRSPTSLRAPSAWQKNGRKLGIWSQNKIMYQSTWCEDKQTVKKRNNAQDYAGWTQEEDFSWQRW